MEIKEGQSYRHIGTGDVFKVIATPWKVAKGTQFKKYIIYRKHGYHENFCCEESEFAKDFSELSVTPREWKLIGGRYSIIPTASVEGPALLEGETVTVREVIE